MLIRDARSVSADHRFRLAPTLYFDTSMPGPQAIIHQFTVLRGMAVALVIETRDWYSGLLQAALARIRLEGLN